MLNFYNIQKKKIENTDLRRKLKNFNKTFKEKVRSQSAPMYNNNKKQQ